MQNFGRLIKETATQQSRHFNNFARKYHLTAVQMSIIDFLNVYKDRTIFQKDVEHEFLIGKAETSSLLKRMEKRNLVARKQLPTDARQRQVVLTPKSERVEAVIAKYMKHQQQLITSPFNKQQISLIRKFFKHVIKINQNK